MNGKDNAFLWGCVDASDGAPSAEKLGIRVKDAEEAQEFKRAWEAAQLFVTKAKKGDLDLVFAAKVEDIREVLDNPDENVHHENADD